MASPIELLDEGTLSSASDLIITDLSLDYIKYEILFSRLYSNESGSDINLAIQTSTNNGSSFTAGGGYTYDLVRGAQSGYGAAPHYPYDASDFCLINNSLSNIDGNFVSGVIEIFNPMNPSTKTTILANNAGKFNISGSINTGVQITINIRNTAEANNALKVFVITNSGTPRLFTMDYVIYGYLGQ